MEIVVIPDRNKKEAVDFSMQVWNWLLKKHVQAALFCSSGVNFPLKPDMAILIGGDGFIMRKSPELGRLKIPFFGINFGRKGFLAVAERDNWEAILSKVLAGKYTIDKRITLLARHLTKAGVKRYEAAGDVYLRHRAGMIEFNVLVDGRVIYENFLADGVIVSSPTGSTGYYLAVGGQFFESGIGLATIAPHAVRVLPLHFDASKKIEIVYLETKTQHDDEGCLLFVDGIKYPIEPGDKVLIRGSATKTYFVIPEGFSFIEAIQRKLGLTRGQS